MVQALQPRNLPPKLNRLDPCCSFVLMTLELTDRQLDDMVSRRAAARLRAFRREAERLFPGRITQVVLFGSRARGDARRDSDYDVAVFVKALGDRHPVDRELSNAAYRHVLEGYHISPVALPDDFLRKMTHPLAFAIAREGLSIS